MILSVSEKVEPARESGGRSTTGAQTLLHEQEDLERELQRDPEEMCS